MTWNIEGFRRNLHSLKHFTVLYEPNLIFLSEPHLLQCDAFVTLQPFLGCYSFHLNSEDLHTPEIALEKSRTKGGTMILWQSSLDPFVTIIPTSSPSVAAIILRVPGYSITAHLAIYLPTSGQEVQFMTAQAVLDSCLDDLLSEHKSLFAVTPM